MERGHTTKSIGGVARIVLHLPTAIVHIEQSADGSIVGVDFDDAAIELPLKEGASAFVEQLSAEGGQMAVTHRLEAVMRCRDGASMFDAETLRRLSQQGTIAEVELADKRRKLVGWSQRFGAVQPLRLEALHQHSGRVLADEPTTTIVLAATDTAFALPII